VLVNWRACDRGGTNQNLPIPPSSPQSQSARGQLADPLRRVARAVSDGLRVERVEGGMPCGSVSHPPTQAEVEALADKFEELINTLNA